MSKYKSTKVIIDWYLFDSKSEATYYQEHKDIPWLRVHPCYELQPAFRLNGKKIQAITYEADFAYDNLVIDVKWLPTQAALLKRKMFMYRYPQFDLCRVVKYKWEWVDYFENVKRRKREKKEKLNNL